MVAPHRRAFVGFLLVADLMLLVGSYATAYWIRFPSYRGPFSADTAHGAAHVVLGVAGVTLWLVLLSVLGFYRVERLLQPGRTLARLVPTALLVGLLLGAALFFVQAKLASRVVWALFVGLSTGTLWLDRWLGGWMLRWWGTRSNPHVLIVGVGEAAARLGRRLAAEPELGGRPVGYLRLGDEDAVVPEGDVLGGLADLEEVLDREVLDRVAVAEPAATAAQIEALAQGCHEVGVDVVVVASEMDGLLVRASLDSLGGAPALRLQGSPQFRATMASKRLFDVALGSVLLVAATPLLGILAALVKLTSRGPVLHVQERVGLNGRRFRFYKVRSMVVDAEARQAALGPRNEMSGPVFKLAEDPRITRVGRLLRRFSLDELPQLFNVVKGDMSLVGPRPPLPSEVARYDRWQRRRLSVKPGLTGPWQVAGRNEVDFADWMQLDLAYIDNWSPWLDLKILAKTIPAVLSGRGAR